MNQRELFDHVFQLSAADSLSTKYWLKRTDLPEVRVPYDENTTVRLATTLRVHFKETEGRGHNCAIEVSEREGGMYFFCYLEDYGRTAVDGELRALDATPTEPVEDAAALLGDLESLWRQANASERSRILSTLVDAVYMGGDGKIVAIVPKAAMVPIFAAIAMRPETGVSLTAAVVGMVETGENRTPRPEEERQGSTTSLAGHLISPRRAPLQQARSRHFRLS